MSFLHPPQDLLDFIKTKPAFFLIPHYEPDGDCIGSSLGLAGFLRRLGKRVYLHNMGPFEKPDIAEFAGLFQGRIPQDLRNAEPDAAVIVLDCSTIDRIGALAEDITGRTVVVIDHHSAGKEFGDFRYIDPHSPSTSLLVQSMIEAMGGTPTKAEADFLFLAFCTDTGFFRHLESDQAAAFGHVERLVAAGASPKATYLRLNSHASLIGRRHLGMLLARTESFADGKVLLCYETQAETQAVGKKNRESDLLYQMLLGIQGVEVIIMLREERPDFITGGLRSKKYVDVGKVALALGGGGHIRAAGFGLETSLIDARRRILDLILPQI